MRWRVAISGLPDNVRLLSEIVDPLGISLVEVEGENFLVGDLFEAEESHSAVHNLALRLELIASEIERDDPAARCGFKSGPIFEYLADGSWRKHAFVTLAAHASARATASATLTVGSSPALSEDERARLEQQRQEQEFQALCQRTIPRFVAAFHSERVRQVQQLLRGELDPLTLGHIAELIEDDLGGATRDLVSERQWTRFQRSINHPDVFGVNARHIVSKVTPPPDPMTLFEARAFIRELANQWTNRKSGLENDR
jgi:hypothetical protein